MTDKVWRKVASPQLPFTSPPPAAPLHHQEPAPSKQWQISSSPPWPPPPAFLPNGPAGEGGCGTLFHDVPSHPPPPLPILPVLTEGRYCPLALERKRRGIKLRKVEQQSCELDINTARQTLLGEIQRGIKLKPVSSDVVTKSRLEFIQAFMLKEDFKSSPWMILHLSIFYGVLVFK